MIETDYIGNYKWNDQGNDNHIGLIIWDQRENLLAGVSLWKLQDTKTRKHKISVLEH